MKTLKFKNIKINTHHAFAVYSADDNSLIFYADILENIPEQGSQYKGKTVTNIYTGFTTETYESELSVPWYSIRDLVKTVIFDKSFASVQPTAMAYWFYEFTNLTDIDATYLDTSKLTTLYYTFDCCFSLTKVDGLSNFDTSKVTDMSYMFYRCESLTSLDVSNFDTSKVTDMSYMFYHCESLTSLDVSNFDTSKVTNMVQMFGYLYNITYLDLSHFNTSNVTAMNGMFRNSEDASGIEVLDLQGWDTSKVTAINAMFRDNHNLKTIYADKDWDLSSVTNDTNMFLECTSLVGGNGTAYDGSKIDSSMAQIDTLNNPGYFTDMNAHTWNFIVSSVDGYNGSPLSGAIYTLYDNRSSDLILFDYNENDNVYYPSNSGNTSRLGTSSTTFTICNIPEGEYSLVQIVAPDGYNLATDPYIISATYDNDNNTFIFTVNDSQFGVSATDDTLSMSIECNAGTFLPGTGN